MTIVSSRRGGRVSWDVNYASEWEPIDPYLRDACVANNVLHCADMAARVLVNDVKPAVAAGVQNVTNPFEYSSAWWAPVAIYGPLVITTVQRPFSAYKLRCALAARIVGSSAVEFAIDVCDSYERAIGTRRTPISPPSGSIGFGSTSSTSPVWLTPSHAVLTVPTWSYLSTAQPPITGDPRVNVLSSCVWVRVIAKGDSQPFVEAVHVAEVYS